MNDECFEDNSYPCDGCADYDHCDDWEAQFCCTLCRWYNEDPICEECNPWDI